MEKSPEISDGHQTALFWEYDSRSVHRWNVDPVDKPNLSSYHIMEGNPIFFTDVLGNTVNSTHTDENGKVIAVYDDGDFGVYRHKDATTKEEVTQLREKTGKTSGGGEKMGETLYWDEFVNTYSGGVMKVNIKYGESWEQLLNEKMTLAKAMDFMQIAQESRNGGIFSIQDIENAQYTYKETLL